MLTFLPASNLLFPTGTIMAERVMYLPSLGVIALAIIGVERGLQPVGYVAQTSASAAWHPSELRRGTPERQRREARQSCVSLALVRRRRSFAVRTWIRNNDWQSDVSLWTATVQTSPRSASKAHRGLAEALYEADPTHANLNRVVAEIERAIGALDSLDAGRNDAKTFRLAGGYYSGAGATISVPLPTSVPYAAAGSRRCL